MVHDGLTCAFDQVHMAVHGSTAAKKYGISGMNRIITLF